MFYTSFTQPRKILLCLWMGLGLGQSCEPVVPCEIDPGYRPEIVSHLFTHQVDHLYFPLIPSTSFWYVSMERNEWVFREVTDQVKWVMGVECAIVRERVWKDGDLQEDTDMWYAQDQEGNVWLFGEDSREIKKGKVTKTLGSWIAGSDGALPGIVLHARFELGQVYRKEYYPCDAEDQAMVQRDSLTLTVPENSYSLCLHIFEWTHLEENSGENKYYAPGVGLLKWENSDGTDVFELVEFVR